VTTAAPTLGLVASIECLPESGRLFDSMGHEIIAQTTLLDARVTYYPNPDWIGADFFEYRLKDLSTGLVSEPARVDLIITAVIDPCAAVGRPPGCSPGR
ncbi:MAG: hypothetical protein GY859_20615, partial [Desulfobacterales bacterium]|nr:hypothetical protein [Desulfobacterales bacterium]